MASVLSRPTPYINGVWNEGGADGVLQAFLKAHRPLVQDNRATPSITSCSTRFSTPGLQMVAGSNPCYMSVTGIEDAVKVLEGQDSPEELFVPDHQYEYPSLVKMPGTFSTPVGRGVYRLDVKGQTGHHRGFQPSSRSPTNSRASPSPLKQLEAAM